MNIDHVHRRRLAAAAAAAVAGAATALAISGALSTTPGATGAASPAHAGAVAYVARGGRTARPGLNRSSYLVQAGRRLRVLVYFRGAWGHPRTCELTVSRGRHDRAYRVRGVVSNFVVVLPTARDAWQGGWKLTVGCVAPRQHASKRTSAAVLVASFARARGTLTLGQPDIEALQAPAPVRSGKTGLGGTPPNPGFPNGQCTYYAYEQRPDIYWTSVDNGAPRYGWDADKWSGYAAQYGHFAEGSTPQAGAIMVQPASSHSSVGHVAYVTQVTDGSYWVTQEMNTDGRGVPGKVFTVYDDNLGGGYDYYVGSQIHRHVLPGTVFIYTGAAPGSTPPPTPTTPTPTPTPTVTQPGTTVTQPGTTVTQPGTTTTTSSPPTWNETPGGVTHTWTNYANAGGSQGPSIPTSQTVQVYCRVQGFTVAEGTTGGIASPPRRGAAATTRPRTRSITTGRRQGRSSARRSSTGPSRSARTRRPGASGDRALALPPGRPERLATAGENMNLPGSRRAAVRAARGRE
jgi:CHAP domain